MSSIIHPFKFGEVPSEDQIPETHIEELLGIDPSAPETFLRFISTAKKNGTVVKDGSREVKRWFPLVAEADMTAIDELLKDRHVSLSDIVRFSQACVDSLDVRSEVAEQRKEIFKYYIPKFPTRLRLVTGQPFYFDASVHLAQLKAQKVPSTTSAQGVGSRNPKNLNPVNGRTKLIASNQSFYTLEVRLRQPSYWHDDWSDGLDAEKVHIVNGESGSGKTCAMLRYQHDDAWGFYAVGNEVFEKDCNSSFSNSERDTAACDKFQEYLTTALSSYPREEIRKCTRFVFILDEMGQFPRYTRALCATWNTLRSNLKSVLKLSESAKVTLLVGGTGCDPNSPGLEGSSSDTFETHQLKNLSFEQQYPEEVALIKAQKDEAGLRAQGLLKNRRSGVLLCTHLRERMTSEFGSVNVSSSVLEAARQYRKLNGLSKVASSVTLDLIIGRALGIVMFHMQFNQLRGTLPSWAPDEYKDEDLLTKYGVLSRVEKSKASQDQGDNSGESDSQEVYHISEAQVTLFLLGYGCDIAGERTGVGFEIQVKDYLKCLFYAATAFSKSTADLRHLMHNFTTDTKFDQVKGNPSFLFETPLSISVHAQPVKLQPHGNEEGINDLMKQVKDRLRKNKIQIVLNGGAAAFADLMVFFPNGEWWSIQCKRFLKSELPSYSALDELSKLGCVEERILEGVMASAATLDFAKSKGKEFWSGSKVMKTKLFDHLVNQKKKDTQERRKAEETIKSRMEFAQSLAKQCAVKGTSYPPFPVFCLGGQARTQFKNSIVCTSKFVQLCPDKISEGRVTKNIDEPTHCGMYPIIPAFHDEESSLHMPFETTKFVSRSKRGREDEESSEADKTGVVDQDANVK